MNHDPFTGTHSHSHSAMGDQGSDDTHSHNHVHNNDADHGHSHAEAKSARLFHQGIERRQRSVSGLQIRSGDAGATTFEGYAAVTGVPTEINDWLGSYQETVNRGAFSKTLSEQDDIRLLLNHDGTPMARTKSGTLALDEDRKGLHSKAELDDASPLVQEISSAMRRGDLDQMSFAFHATRQEWNADRSERQIDELKLFDVSIVTFPAYDSTTAVLRSRIADPMLQIRLAFFAKELREGKTFNSQNMQQLTDLLDALAQIDDLTDEWQPKLAEMLGVKNPDADDDKNEGGEGDTEAKSMALAKSYAARNLLQPA